MLHGRWGPVMDCGDYSTEGGAFCNKCEGIWLVPFNTYSWAANKIGGFHFETFMWICNCQMDSIILHLWMFQKILYPSAVFCTSVVFLHRLLIWKVTIPPSFPLLLFTLKTKKLILLALNLLLHALNWSSCSLPQGKNLISVLGKDARGSLPALTNWLGISVNTLESNHFSVQTVTAASPARTTLPSTERDTCLSKQIVFVLFRFFLDFLFFFLDFFYTLNSGFSWSESMQSIPVSRLYSLNLSVLTTGQT